MKKTIILLFLLIIPLVIASKTETTKVLHINDTISVYGKTLKVLDASNTGYLRVRVDGIEGMVKPRGKSSTNVNEMFVTIKNFTYIDPEYSEIILKIIVQDECGDKGCNGSETSVSCCKDCGCKNNMVCVNNVCKRDKCVIHLDCDDKNPCTVDQCSNSTPKTCSRINITKCLNDDACCPPTCKPTNDNDCVTVVEEKKEEGPKSIKEEVIEKAQIVKSKVKDIPKERLKGALIMAGVALLVIIIGFLFFRKK